MTTKTLAEIVIDYSPIAIQDRDYNIWFQFENEDGTKPAFWITVYNHKVHHVAWCKNMKNSSFYPPKEELSRLPEFLNPCFQALVDMEVSRRQLWDKEIPKATGLIWDKNNIETNQQEFWRGYAAGLTKAAQLVFTQVRESRSNPGY